MLEIREIDGGEEREIDIPELESWSYRNGEGPGSETGIGLCFGKPEGEV